MEHERATYLMAGMQSVIGKPLDLAELVEAIERALARTEAQARSSAA